MSHDAKFSQDITNFQRYGTYTYESDEVGNVIFNSASNDFSQVYLGLPLPNFVYDNTKLVSFYDPTFTEFIPATTASAEVDTEQLQNELEAQQLANAELTQQLNDLIAVNESTPSLADQVAAKQVILELRKSLGQGRVDSDFSEEFPYTPLKKEASIDSTATTQTTAAASAAQTVAAAAPVATQTTTPNSATSGDSEALAAATAALTAAVTQLSASNAALSSSAPPPWFSSLQKKQEDEERRRRGFFGGRWYRGKWYEK